MKSQLLVSSALLFGALGATACSATMGSSTEPKVVGEQAELVARKKEWLKVYDADCEICFKAFDQCQLGARQASEEDACQVALDACVRGGMIDANGGGRDDDDDDDDDDDAPEADAGHDAGDDGRDGGEDNGEDDPNDGGVDDDAGAGDNDGDADDAGVEGDDDDDEEPTGGDPGKKALLDAIRQCVSEAGACTDVPGADERACLGTLRTCVKEALAAAFESVCDSQIAQCDRDNAPREARRSVEQLCETGLQGDGRGR